MFEIYWKAMQPAHLEGAQSSETFANTVFHYQTFVINLGKLMG